MGPADAPLRGNGARAKKLIRRALALGGDNRAVGQPSRLIPVDSCEHNFTLKNYPSYILRLLNEFSTSCPLD
jgi:hypothetical protein